MKKISLFLTALFAGICAYSQTYLTENFDSPFSGSPAAPTGWTQSRIVLVGDGTPEVGLGEKDWERNVNTGPSAWTTIGGTVPAAAVNGTGVLFMNDIQHGPTVNAIGSRRMESPTLNLTGSTSPYVRFFLFYANNSQTVNLRVVASNDGGVTWNPIMIVPANAGITGTMISSTPWQRINVLVPTAYRVANAKIGIEYTNAGSTQNIWIDDFSVMEFTPTTITSAATGLWSATTTWVGGVVPTADNHVVIATGHTVSANVQIARCQNVTVNGILTYSSTTATLLMHIFGDLTVNAGGAHNSFFSATGKRTYLGGNLINNGSINFSVGAGNLVWLGGGPATYSGSGTLTGGFISNLWHANAGGVTYNAPVEVRNTCGLYNGTVNPNGNLTVGNSLVATQTIERATGSFASAPIWGTGVARSVNYVTTFFNMLTPQTLMQGEEMRMNTGVRVVENTFTMAMHNNLQLTSPSMVGTTTSGALTLTRGIVITSSTNLLTLSSFVNTTTVGAMGQTPTTVNGNGTIPTTQGSYIAGPLRKDFPTGNNLPVNFTIGVGSALNNNLPSSNALRMVTFNNGSTNWSGQTITMEITGPPSGTVNLPAFTLFTPRAYRMDLNGGPSIPATAAITLRYNNSTFGNSENIQGPQDAVRIVQSPNLTGPWTQRNMPQGSGTIPANTLMSVTSATTSPGPINDDMFFAWASIGAPTDVQVQTLVSPAFSYCASATSTVTVRVYNVGFNTINLATDNITVNVSVAGPNPQTFTPVVLNTGTLASAAFIDVTVSTTYDMTMPGNYVFSASTTMGSDMNTSNDAMSPVTVISQNPSISMSSTATYCIGSPVQLNPTTTANGISPLNPATFSNSTDFPILDLQTTVSPLSVTTPVNANSILAVRLDTILHTWISDLNITLIAPNGSFIDLSSGNGGSGDNYIMTVLGTTGPSIVTGVAPMTGNFQPEQPISALTGPATGTWNLSIYDAFLADQGTLSKWSILVPGPNSITTYSWAPAAGLSSTTIANPMASPTATTTYTLTITDLNGCTTSSTVTVTPAALPVVSLGADQVVCADSPVLLDAQNPGDMYLWSPGGQTTQQITVTTTGTYIATVTSTTTGCSNSDTVNITVNPLPVQALGPDVTACGSAVLDAQNSGSTYLWSTGETTQSITVTTTGTYTVGITSPDGCANSDTINVTIDPVPPVALGADAGICIGDSIVLDAQNPGDTYLWSTGATTQTIVVNTTGTYNVIVTNSFGCTGSDTIVITVNALPVVALGNDTTMCANSYVLDAQNPGSSYLWNTTATTQQITVTASGSYDVTVTDLNGCSNSDTINVTLNAPPVQPFGNDTTLCATSVVLDALNPGSTYIWSTSATTQQITATASGTYMVDITTPQGCMISDTIDIVLNPPAIADAGDDTTICLGNSLTLIGGAPGNTSYTWTFNNVNVNSQLITLAPTDTTLMILTVTNSFGCTDSDTMIIYVLPQPSASFTSSTLDNVTFNFTNTSVGASPTTYTWNFGDGSPLSTAMNPSHTYAANGTYNVTLTIQTPCGVSVFNSTVTVTSVGFADIIPGSLSLDVYPNPGKGEFQLIIPGAGAGKYEIAVMNMEGRMIYKEQIITITNDLTHTLDLSAFANGIYYLRVASEGHLGVKKLVIQK